MEQAREKAASTIRDMGIDYLEVSCVEEQTIIERDDYNFPIAIRPCYKIYLMRNVDGITANYAVPRELDIPLPEGMTHDDYYMKAPNEEAEITIAKEGIIDFQWGPVTKIADTKSESVELLKFEDIQDIVKRQVIMNNVQSELDMIMGLNNVAVKGRKITIEEAKLGLMCVKWQGHEAEYLMIPVWDFYGYESFVFQDPADAIQKQMPVDANGRPIGSLLGGPKSFLTLSAIDGSVINRTIGYW
jgi:hypothetical protein